jgi:Fic family protein
VNRIKSIQASLAIENNTLSIEQVTALLDGKRVLGPVKEVQEVRNAFDAYESLSSWNPHNADDLLKAHALMMKDLVDRPGVFRSGGVGIAKGEKVVHVAPPAQLVPGLMKDLLGWLEKTDVHPLIASCVFHYELEFIHPFADGNGRIGRLWQTLILSQWKAPLAYLPVEDIIRKNQQSYYNTLAACDKVADSAQFIEFLLESLLQALLETHMSDQDTVQVSDQVKSLLKVLKSGSLSAVECMEKLKLSHRPTFRKNYLNPAMAAGKIERTIPDTPNSRFQKYRLIQ